MGSLSRRIRRGTPEAVEQQRVDRRNRIRDQAKAFQERLEKMRRVREGRPDAQPDPQPKEQEQKP